MNVFRFFPGYDTYIYGGGREPEFLMLVAFILTLAGTRFYTRMARTRGWEARTSATYTFTTSSLAW